MMHQIYVRQTIEAGINDSDEGRTMDIKDVREKFGLKKWEFSGPRMPLITLPISLNT